MINLPLDEMSVEEKLQLMELLWDDLCKRPENIPSPKWRREVLEERMRSRECGEEVAEDWETVKERLLRELVNKQQSPRPKDQGDC